MSQKKQETASNAGTQELENVWLPDISEDVLPGYQGSTLKLLASGNGSDMINRYLKHVRKYVADNAESHQEVIDAYNNLVDEIDAKDDELRARVLELDLGDEVDVDAMVRGGLTSLVEQKDSLKQEMGDFLLDAHIDAFDKVFLKAIGKTLSGTHNGSSGNSFTWDNVHVVDVCGQRRVYAMLEDGRLAIYDDKGTHIQSLDKEDTAKLGSISSATRLQNWHTVFYTDKVPSDYKHDESKGQILSRLAYALEHPDWKPNSNGRTNTDDLDSNRLPQFVVSREDWMKKVKEASE